METLSLHGRPLALVQPFIQPGARLLVLSANANTPARGGARAARARLRPEPAHGAVPIWAAGNERMHAGTADSYRSEDAVADLNTLAIECVADPGAPLAPRTPGLADELYEHDGQLTKHEVRAITLAALGPVPGQLLWDVGAGCGSIGIEWMRTHPECRAVAIEPDGRRLEMIAANSAALGVPGIDVVNGRAVAAPRRFGRTRRGLRGRRDHRARPAGCLPGRARARRASGGERGVGRRRGPSSTNGSARTAAA